MCCALARCKMNPLIAGIGPFFYTFNFLSKRKKRFDFFYPLKLFWELNFLLHVLRTCKMQDALLIAGIGLASTTPSVCTQWLYLHSDICQDFWFWFWNQIKNQKNLNQWSTKLKIKSTPLRQCALNVFTYIATSVNDFTYKAISLYDFTYIATSVNECFFMLLRFWGTLWPFRLFLGNV